MNIEEPAARACPRHPAGTYAVMDNVTETASKTLMCNQDLRHKGNSTGLRKKGKCITFWVTDEQKAEISTYAAEHGMTVSRLIVEGLELRMD